MEDESATEMDSNHPLPAHHQTHHQHHLDMTLNESKKRTNNHNLVSEHLNNSCFSHSESFLVPSDRKLSSIVINDKWSQSTKSTTTKLSFRFVTLVVQKQTCHQI